MIARALVGLMFLAGLWGLVAKRNIVKKIFGLSILTGAAVIFFVLEGSRVGSSAPIIEAGVASIVDPVPQALMLTAVVIGVCVTALALAMARRLFGVAGTFDIDRIRENIRNER